MKKMYFIVNLIAGKAVIAKKLGRIIDEFVKADYEVTVHTTQSSDDVVKATQYACNSNFDLIVCAGGDGTLSNCLQAMMRSEKKLPLGYIPAGTTNDFAKGLNIPKDTMAAVRQIIEGTPMPQDVGGFNDDYFTYIVAFGAFTSITYETSQQIKNIFGHSAYVLNALLQLTNIHATPMKIEYDDKVIEDEFVFGMVSNTASVAGLFSVNDFKLDDGVFEVLLIKKPANPIQLQQILHSLLNMMRISTRITSNFSVQIKLLSPVWAMRQFHGLVTANLAAIQEKIRFSTITRLFRLSWARREALILPAKMIVILIMSMTEFIHLTMIRNSLIDKYRFRNKT